MFTLSTHQGIAGTWQIQCRDSSGNPYTGFAGTEPLTGSLRLERDAAPLATLVPVWANGPAGLVNLPVPSSVTATLVPGNYPVQVALADGSADLLEGLLAVEYSPGALAIRTNYVPFVEITKRAKFLIPILKKSDDPTALEFRADAWDWLIDLLQRHYRGGGGLSRDYYFLPWPAFSPGSGNMQAAIYRPGIRSQALAGWLTSGGLGNSTGVILVTPVIEMMACYAIGKICQGEIGPKDNGYERLARRFLAEAESRAMNLTVEIDINNDGVSDLAIQLGTADTLNK